MIRRAPGGVHEPRGDRRKKRPDAEIRAAAGPAGGGARRLDRKAALAKELGANVVEIVVP